MTMRKNTLSNFDLRVLEKLRTNERTPTAASLPYDVRFNRRVQELLQREKAITRLENHREEPTAPDTSEDLLSKVERIHRHIQDNVLHKPDLDIKVGSKTLMKLSDDGLEHLVLTDKGYNSYLLFTELGCLLPKSSVLMVGEPGSGKTAAPIVYAQFVYGVSEEEVKRSIIRGNPEMTTSDILAYTDVAKLIHQGIEVLHPRTFMKSKIRIIDEVNRIPPGKVAILYEVADTGEVNYKNKIFKAPPGPLFATANFKDSGNYLMQKPFMDRFDIVLQATSLNPNYFKLLGKRTSIKAPAPLTLGDLGRIRHQISAIKWTDDAISRLAYFANELNSCDLGGRTIERKVKGNAGVIKPGIACDECRYSKEENICNQTEEAISARTYSAISSFSQAYSWRVGSTQVTPDIVAQVLPYVLSHRMTPTKHAKDPGYQNDRIAFIDDLFSKAMHSYELACQKAPVIQEIPHLVASSKQGNMKVSKKQLDDYMKNSISKLDSPSKFAYATSLAELYAR